MAKLTAEELEAVKKLHPGYTYDTKCDNCGRLLTGMLTYQSRDGKQVFCCNSCLEQGDPTVSKRRKDTAMVTPSGNKQDKPDVTPKTEPKKNKKDKKADKKAAKAAAKAAKSPKAPKQKAPKAPKPKKEKKAITDPKDLFREGTIIRKVFEKMSDQKPHKRDDLFKGKELEAVPFPHRVLGHIALKGESSGLFKAYKNEDDTWQLKLK